MNQSSAGYQTIVSQFHHNRLLFGDSSDAGVVAIEISAASKVAVFKRLDDKIVLEERPLSLFLLTSDRAMLKGLSVAHTTTELTGSFELKYISRFTSLSALETAKRHLRKVTGQPSGSNEAPYLVLSDPVEQHLMLTGSTFFMGLELSDLRRMQIDIEVALSEGFDVPNAQRSEDRIVLIAVSDSTGYEAVIAYPEEKHILERFAQIVAERDPDVIEGHSLLRFGLEYLEARARRHRLELKLGRDGSRTRSRPSRMQIAERTIAYRRTDIYGRSLIDTWILAQHYDIGRRELEGFELRDLCGHFKLERDERPHLDPTEIARRASDNIALVGRHALDNAIGVRRLAESLSASYFVQSQIFPYSFQNVVLRGNATKIDSLMLRAYLKENHSIPLPSPAAPFPGGYTEVRRAGVARDVLHCDVTSLYPSLMLHYSHGPANDVLNLFLKMLSDLRDFRLQAKMLARKLDGVERQNIEALQQTFKILINSFYGYLGFSFGHFNDFGRAAEVTRRGRELIQRSIRDLEDRGYQVVEVDTDGVYFVASAIYADEPAQDALLKELAEAMPSGIRLEIDGRYPAMFSYKMKNYALLDEADTLTIRGSGLKSRGLERFQRTFMEEMFRLLLTGREREVGQLLERYQRKIERHETGVRDLMKTETLQDSLDAYRQKVGGKRRNAAAAYELAVKSGRQYQSGDQISWYVTGSKPKVKVSDAARLASAYDPNHPDENVEYYKSKLLELFAKFKPFIDQPQLREALGAESLEGAEQGEMFGADTEGSN